MAPPLRASIILAHCITERSARSLGAPPAFLTKPRAQGLGRP